MKRLIAVVSVIALSGCHIMMSTPSGVREFYRGQNGLVTTGKASPDIDDAYHKTQRETDPGMASLREKLAEMRGAQ